MAAKRLKRIGLIIALAILMFSLVLVPGSESDVVADTIGGGQPVEPPPDTTTTTSQPGSSSDDWTEVRVFIATVSSMIL